MDAKIAYFSMEIALNEEMPTYSGGLGVLAGDFLRSAATLEVPLVAITLIHKKGYFLQKLEENGWQKEWPEPWPIVNYLVEVEPKISVSLEDRQVFVKAWKYLLKERKGVVPIFLLDTDLPENSEWDRTITDQLYGNDAYYRICQEAILGIGGVRMLKALGYQALERYHMNEGHSSFLTLELLDESARAHGRNRIEKEDIDTVKKLCIFTTHTPVMSGHDQFSTELVNRVLKRPEFFEMKNVFCCDGLLNMTFLGFNLSHYINGVAKRHGEVSQQMFGGYSIDAITNGINPLTWSSPPFQKLYDHYISGWKDDHFSLRYALSIPKVEVWKAHLQAKSLLAEYVKQKTHTEIDLDCFTIGFGRRAAAYKRLDLLFYEPAKLEEISKRLGPLQIICAGKAHPQDIDGKKMIQRIFEAKSILKNNVRVIYLENYNLRTAKLLTAGTDLWLNTPQPPLEASGTSGMKASLNGVPSLSILDGWWIEGCIEGITGWAIGQPQREGFVSNTYFDAHSLYDKLETILSLYYKNQDAYIEVMRHAIALNGSFFNTQRMVLQYVLNAYFR